MTAPTCGAFTVLAGETGVLLGVSAEAPPAAAGQGCAPYVPWPRHTPTLLFPLVWMGLSPSDLQVLLCRGKTSFSLSKTPKRGKTWHPAEEKQHRGCGTATAGDGLGWRQRGCAGVSRHRIRLRALFLLGQRARTRLSTCAAPLLPLWFPAGAGAQPHVLGVGARSCFYTSVRANSTRGGTCIIRLPACLQAHQLPGIFAFLASQYFCIQDIVQLPGFSVCHTQFKAGPGKWSKRKWKQVVREAPACSPRLPFVTSTFFNKHLFLQVPASNEGSCSVPGFLSGRRSRLPHCCSLMSGIRGLSCADWALGREQPHKLHGAVPSILKLSWLRAPRGPDSQ